MNESQKVARNTAVLAVATLVERAGAIVLVFVLSRTVHAHGLGIHAAVLALYGLLALLAEVGVSSFIVREVAKDRSKTQQYVLHLSAVAIVAGLVVMSAAALILPYLGYSPELRAGSYLVLLAVIPGTLNVIHEAVYVAHQRVAFQTYTTLIVTVGSLTASIVLLLLGYGVVSVIAAFVASRYVMMFCYLLLTSCYIAPLRGSFQLSFGVALLREIRLFAASSFLAGFFSRPEILLLSVFSNETHIGFYSAALKLVDLWQVIPETFLTNVFPVMSRFYHQADQHAQLLQERSVKYLFALSLPIAVGLTVAAEPIIRLVFGQEFLPAVLVLQILAWNLPVSCLNSMLWRILVARDQQNRNVQVQLVTACTRIVSGCLVIFLLGPLGAALTTIGNLFLHNRMLAYFLQRDGIRLDVWRLTWRFAVAAAGMGVIVWLLLNSHTDLWMVVPVAAGCYGIWLFVLRAFSADEITVMSSLLPARVGGK
ncbi:MAG: flippase [Deltaproteobacteria bacterium]|nr:flippase [Deltaproteobacteria bacterium]